MRLAREFRGLSREQLSRLANVAQTTINRLETLGRARPQSSTARLLIGALHRRKPLTDQELQAFSYRLDLPPRVLVAWCDEASASSGAADFTRCLRSLADAIDLHGAEVVDGLLRALSAAQEQTDAETPGEKPRRLVYRSKPTRVGDYEFTVYQGYGGPPKPARKRASG